MQVSENAPLRSFSHFPFRTPLTKSSDSVEEKRAPFTFMSILCTQTHRQVQWTAFQNFERKPLF
jgi:hypothetical protein